MKTGRRWVIVDTETDGLYEPIHVVELSAQVMRGWEPDGEPFRMLLNHNVPIPPEAVAIHGYTRDFLLKNGEEPRQVHSAFRAYAKDYPLVAHNLSYDWNRCLEPEWRRLGIPQIGQRGFCCMMLARRLAPEADNYRLETLKECFQLTPNQGHRAYNDVITLVELFQRVYRLRLEPVGLDTYDAIAAFAKRTPVAKCIDQIRAKADSSAPSTLPKDEWYYLDANNDAHGPLSAFQIATTVNLDRFYVWRPSMADWAINQEYPQFLELAARIPTQTTKKFEATKSMSELIGVCRGILADSKITTAEVMFLNSWLQNAGFLHEWPASEIAQCMERILEDGIVSKEEKEELKRLLERIV